MKCGVYYYDQQSWQAERRVLKTMGKAYEKLIKPHKNSQVALRVQDNIITNYLHLVALN
jgi:hypothetical protein